MVRSAKLRLGVIAVLVVLGHVVALEWIARQADWLAGLTPMAPTLYTRTVKPAAPPPVPQPAAPAPAPQPKPRVAPLPKPAASSPEEVARDRERTRERAMAQVRELERERQLAQERERDRLRAEQAEQQAAAASESASAASAPALAASAPALVASASAPAASAPRADVALDQWPTDTRLTYQLGGDWRGPLYGDARVQWQREGDKYQVRLDVKIQPFITQVLTSQGEVTPEGLIPRAYEELRPGKRRVAQFGDQVLVLENGRTVPRPPGVQDTASQFVELSQRFATGKEILEVGRTVTVWLARPGGLDQWTYDIVERVTLRTPKLGDVEAFHLKPRPIANPRGNITAEMWFAPSLQYLPVRIKVIMGTEAYLDLLVDHIEQR